MGVRFLYIYLDEGANIKNCRCRCRISTPLLYFWDLKSQRTVAQAIQTEPEGTDGRTGGQRSEWVEDGQDVGGQVSGHDR